jgi:type I restriction enzyme S subunit
MRLETFFENFELLADAPNGVQKLRELILDLAVRGKLVAQDSTNESAVVLIEKINVEKKRLIKEKKIRKSEPLSPIEPEEVLYELPDGWKWVRFGDVTICRDGERIPLSREERMTRQGNYDYYGASGVIDRIDNYLFDKPLLLIGEDGANLINRSTPIAFIAIGKYWVNNHAHVLDSISLDCLRYLEVFINAIDLTPYVTGTAQPKMNQAKMNSIPVALPPIEEQKRIVVKVDELMSLCDRLEERQQKRRTQRILLNNAALDQLLGDRQPEEFSKHWRRICNNFDLLYSTPENIGKLRQAILQLAVQGKLVPQDSNDEPASVLLEKIKFEKEQLVKEGKIKNDKQLPPIKVEEIPFELPDSWEWVRGSEVSIFVTSGSRGWAKYYSSNGAIFLRIGNLDYNTISLDLTSIQRVEPLEGAEGTRTKVKYNDILISITGDTGMVGSCSKRTT